MPQADDKKKRFGVKKQPIFARQPLLMNRNSFLFNKICFLERYAFIHCIYIQYFESRQSRHIYLNIYVFQHYMTKSMLGQVEQSDQQ